ncbi:MAG: PTS transporter subunit EIIC [Oscillospiraceae bacterium]|jgi:PTS system beta-glucosides-specific IIC component|nr:PTS transporter subunit EIIC [Oscillospiraceae bacterium]
MDYKVLAESIIDLIGGKVNVASVTHCVTRLRFVLKDESIAKTEELKATRGILGVAQSGGQYQIILGNIVGKVYEQTLPLLGFHSSEEADGEQPTQNEIKVYQKMTVGTVFNTFFKTISGIIMPLIGPLAAAGIIKGILALCTSIHALDTTSGTYVILYAVSNGFFYFLPIILGFSAGVKFKANPYVCAAIGAALVYPDIIALATAGTNTTFLTVPVIIVNYSSSIFPIMIAAWVASRLEHFLEKTLPDAVKMIFTPLLTILIVVPISFLAIGPVMTYVSQGLANGVMAIYSFCPLLSGIILGAFWQLVVVFGLHYAFIPILINNITTMHKDPINAILCVTVFALAGAALGFALKQKNKEKKSLGFSTSITGLLGVTEPIIYGIGIPYKLPFLYAFIGGGIAGAITAGMHAYMFSFGNGGLFAAPMFLNPDGIDSSFVAYCISAVVAFVIPIVLSLIFGVEPKGTNKKKHKNKNV